MRRGDARSRTDSGGGRERVARSRAAARAGLSRSRAYGSSTLAARRTRALGRLPLPVRPEPPEPPLELALPRLRELQALVGLRKLLFELLRPAGRGPETLDLESELPGRLRRGLQPLDLLLQLPCLGAHRLQLGLQHLLVQRGRGTRRAAPAALELGSQGPPLRVRQQLPGPAAPALP